MIASGWATPASASPSIVSPPLAEAHAPIASSRGSAKRWVRREQKYAPLRLPATPIMNHSPKRSGGTPSTSISTNGAADRNAKRPQ